MTINCKYIKGYQLDDNLMNSFYKFTQQIFEFDLVAWKNAGHWGKDYELHTLVNDGSIIANISACIMHLQIAGKSIPAVQLGSVGVLPEFRGQGLSRILLEKVLSEYQQYPLILLFANRSVLDYYPKFGFKQVKENVMQIDVANQDREVKTAVKINIGAQELKQMLAAKLQGSSIIDARGNAAVYWFHLLYNYSENLYYIGDKNVIFIAKYQDESVTIIDVLAEDAVRFDEISSFILKKDTKTVYFGFTPDWLNVHDKVNSNPDDVMYVLGKFPENLPNFKFPLTAHT